MGCPHLHFRYQSDVDPFQRRYISRLSNPAQETEGLTFFSALASLACIPWLLVPPWTHDHAVPMRFANQEIAAGEICRMFY